MTSTTGEAQDLDVTDSGLLSDPGGQGGQVNSNTPPLPEAMEQQALTTCPSRGSPALEELNHIHVDIPPQLSPSVSHTVEEPTEALASSSTSSSSSLDDSKTNLPNTGATASTLAPKIPSQTAPSSSPSPSPPNPTPPTCSSCGLSSSPTTSSTVSSTNASSSSSSPASSSGVSLSSSSSPPAELLPTGGNCSPVDSGTSSCLTLVQEEEETFSRAALEEGVGDGASTTTLSRSSCSGSNTCGSNTSVGSSCSDASNSSVEFELQQQGHEQLNSISVPEKEDSSGSTTSSTTGATTGAKHHSQEVNGSLNTGAPTEPNGDHVHDTTGGRSPTQEQQGASGHYAQAQEAVSDSSSAQLAQQGAGLQPPHNIYHQGIPASSPHPQPNHRHTPPPPDTPPPPPPPPSSQKTQQQPPPPPLPPRNGIGRGAGVSSRAAPTGVTGPPGVVDVCGRCGGRRVQDTCGDRLLNVASATSDFSPLTDDTSALLAADELARTCSLQTQEENHHPQQRPPVSSSSAGNGCGCAGRVWGGGGVVGGDHHHHQACTGGVGGAGGGGGSSGSGRRALPPVTHQSHVVPSRAGIQIQNGLQEGNTSAAKTNTSNAHPDSGSSSRNVINYHISLDKTHLDIADSPTFITDKTTSFIDNITSSSNSNSGSSDGANTTGASGALKGKNQETKTKKSYKDSLIKRYKAYKTAKIEQKQQEQKGRRASIETIMEFDENFHGNDDDDGLDSPMSDCTSLFSLGSDAEACLQEVMEGLGEDYCLTGGGGASSGDSSPVHGEGRSLRWDKGRRKVRRPRSLTKADYQAVRQQCEGSGNGSALDPGGSNNNNNNGRARFVVQVDGQRLTPEEVADSVVSLPGKSGPRMAESSFMEIDNIPSVSQPSTPCMPDIGPALPGGVQAQRLENKHKSNSLEGGSDQAGRYPSKHNSSTFVHSPNGNTTPHIGLLQQGSSSRASPEVSTSNSSTAAARALSAQGGAVHVQRPDVLNLNLTSPNSDPGAADRGGTAGLPTSPSQGTGAPQDPTGTQQQQAPYLLTPGGHRCCTCGQTIPNPGGNPADNANNGDSLNGNLVNTNNDRSVSTVVDVHVNASNHDDPGGKDAPSDVTDVAVPPPVPSRSQTMTPMTPSQRFAYIEALQKEKQRSSIKGQSLAPPLHDNLRYHAFFLYHNNDRDWVLNVMEKLESPTLGFKCCCHERDLDCSLSLPQAVLYGMKNSVKTVVVLSPDFVSSTWSSCEVVVSELDGGTLQRDLLLVMLQDCDLPHLVTDLPYIDASKRDWWTKLLATLALPDDTPMTEETVLSMSSSLVGLNPGLQSGHLLHSIKSKCLCCGRELVDPTEVPDELIAHGVQIPPEEYCQAIRQLMCETKFRCHIWCYNMPVAMVFFTLFLGLCLAIIPVIETKYMFSGTDLTHPSLPTPASKGVSVQPSKKQTGLEYVHGAVVWLCVLTLYMLCTHLARRKMKDKTYRRLSEVNTVFIKYNLLVGVENLGLADCNKYYLHFFYFELGPCLAYLQELVDNLEDVSPCYTNQAYLQELLVNLEECTPCYSNQVLENDAHLEDGEDAEGLSQEASASDRMNVLDQNNITNVSMQTHAEDLLLDHSGEYINMLITKKLDRPRKQRHVKGAYCLCQFVEQRVYKMVV